MNQIKRQRSFIQSIDYETKKLRSELNILHSQPRNCLENLSNELFYEIFDYLDGYDAYNAFSNLNHRFQNMITCSSIPIKINLCSKSISKLEHRCRHFIIPNKHRLLSLHLKDDSVINAFFKYCIIDSTFNRLESIILAGLTDRQLLCILFYLNSLPRLLSLTIHMEEDYYYNLGDIYRLIFALSTLRYNKLSLLSCEELDIVLPNIINTKVCFIRYLVVDYSCTVNQLTSLLCHTPHLCHLTCEGLTEFDTNIEKDLSITLPQLTYFSVGECELEFNEFELFIKKISSQLQVLSINISWNTTYLSANQWERIIKKHIPHLNKFHFHYDQYIDETFSVDPGYNFINEFTSPFWIEKKWFCELKIVRGDLMFFVRPSRKADNCPIQLIIDAHSCTESTRLFVEKMKSSCISVRFSHLNINCNGTSIGMLTKMIHLLPNLDFLKISSLSSLQLNTLSVEDTKKRLSVSMINKITKVKLDKIIEEKQIQFLFNFCPRIQYLEVDCMTNTDLKMLMKYILVNQMTHIPNLCSLCLNIPNANENMIQKIAKTIELETLVENYTLQRIGDKILLDWKLL